jgi:TolB-like protein
MTTQNERRDAQPDAIDRYLGMDTDAGLLGDGSTAEPDPAADEVELHARCDAVMTLAPKLSESADLAWAFDEARRIARSAPPRAADRGPRPWFQRPGPAWGVAAVMASVALVLGVLTLADRTGAPEGPSMSRGATVAPVAAAAESPAGSASATTAAVTATSITFSPIIMPGLSAAQLAALADIDPVVLIAGEVAVDGRSIAVLPFSVAADAGGIGATADAVYRRLVQQLTAIPGLYVIDPAVAAAYADSELPSARIARYLGVRGVVEGHVDTDGNRLVLELTFTDAAQPSYSVRQAFAWSPADQSAAETSIADSVIDALSVARRPTY